MATDITSITFGTIEELQSYLDTNNINAIDVVAIEFIPNLGRFALFHK